MRRGVAVFYVSTREVILQTHWHVSIFYILTKNTAQLTMEKQFIHLEYTKKSTEPKTLCKTAGPK